MQNGMILLWVSVFWIVSEIALARGRKSADSDAIRDPSLTVLWIAIILAVTAGTIASSSEEFHFADHARTISTCGLGLIVAGLVLRWIAIYQLGKMFTVNVAILRDHVLVQSGLYRIVRHPSYTGSLLSFLGLGFALANKLSVVLIFVPVLAAFLYRIVVEERALEQRFGDAYRDYCRTSKRLIPWIY